MIKKIYFPILGAVLWSMGLQTQQASAADTESLNEVIVSENFSKFIEGSEEDPCMDWSLPKGWEEGNQDLGEEWTEQPGWWGMGIFSAGGTCALAYPGYGGAISTPRGSYFGKITVSFRARTLYDADYPVEMIVGVYPTGNFFDVVTLNPEDGWKDYTFTYYCTYDKDKAAIQFNATHPEEVPGGVLIDDIVVTRDLSYLMTPIATDATDFTYDGFTANWKDVPGADYYTLEVFREVISGNENVIVSEDFENVENNPEKLENGLEISAGTVIDGIGDQESRGICFDNGEGYFVTPYTGGKVVEFEYDVIARNLPGYEGEHPTGQTLFYGFDGSNWVLLGSNENEYFPFDEKYNINFTTYEEEYGFFAFKNKYYQIKVEVIGGTPGTPVCFDNVHFNILPGTEREYVADNLTATENHLAIAGLDPYSDYYYQVKAHSETGVSDLSLAKFALGVAAPKTGEAKDVTDRSFVATWESTPKATGFLISSYIKHTTDGDELLPVISENFKDIKANGGTIDNPYFFENYSPMSLDNYTKSKGWTGVYTILAEGMIGCFGDMMGMSEITSPVINLSDNDGHFSVTLKGYGEVGCEICIIYNYEKMSIQLADNWFEETVYFDNGTTDAQIIISSPTGSQFLLSDIIISKMYPAGTDVFTLVESKDLTENETEYAFTDLPVLEGDDIYTYDVTSIRDYYGIFYKSDPSDMVEVHTPVNVATVRQTAKSISVAGNEIYVNLDKNDSIYVYDVAGYLVKMVNGSEGSNILIMEESGLYIIVTSDLKEKAYIR